MTTRDELEVVLSKLYYYYSIIRDKENKRAQAIKLIEGVLSVAFLLGLFFIRMDYGPNFGKALIPWPLNIYFPTIAIVIWAGFIGGFMSLLVRLVNIPSKGDDYLVAELDTVLKTLYSGPIIGAVFAVVLFAGFVSGLVQGTMFPSFTIIDAAGSVVNEQPRSSNELYGPSEQTTSARERPAVSRRPNPEPPHSRRPTPDALRSSHHPTTPSLQHSNTPSLATSPPRHPATSATPSPPPAPVAPDELNRQKAIAEREAVRQDLTSFVPQDGRALALLLFWSFVAGYIQTLVPDKLKAITSKSSS